MAKTSMIEREKRREKLVKQHAAKRARLKETIRSPKSTDSEREEAARKLQAMPRDTSAVAAAQPLRDHRALAGHLSQVRPRRAPSCARRRCAATFPACARPAGKAAYWSNT